MQQIYALARDAHESAMVFAEDSDDLSIDCPSSDVVMTRQVEAIEMRYGTRDAYASIIVLFIDRLLGHLTKLYRFAGGRDNHAALEPFDYSIAEIMRAAGNNIRHAEDWELKYKQHLHQALAAMRAGREPDQIELRSDQLHNLQILTSVLGPPRKERPQGDDVVHFDDIVAWHILSAIGDSYNDVETNSRKYMYELVETLGLHEHIQIRIARDYGGIS